LRKTAFTEKKKTLHGERHPLRVLLQTST